MMHVQFLQSLDTSALPLKSSTPEFSRTVRLEDIQTSSATITLDATADECAALAQRFDLQYVRDLSAEISYRRVRGGQMIRVDGRISANYGQLCSVSEVPMAMMMEDSFQTEYTLSAWEKFSEFDLDQPEILTDDYLDMGEIAAQYFGLGIDPYARRAGADTLTGLVAEVSLAVQELLEIAVPETPDVTEMVGAVLQDNNDPLAEDANPASCNLLAAGAKVPEVEEIVPSPAQGPESLFFKFLRKMRE